MGRRREDGRKGSCGNKRDGEDGLKSEAADSLTKPAAALNARFQFRDINCS